MIEADAGSLGEFLKSKGVQTAVAGAETASAVSAVTSTNPANPLDQAVTNTTDSLDKFTNLLESINKLISSPLVKGVIDKGVERKFGQIVESNQQQVIDVPEGYNPPNNTNIGGDAPSLAAPSGPKEPKKDTDLDLGVDKREKAALFYTALLKAVEEMVKADEKRTIKEVFEELSQEVVKEQLINQMEVLM